MTDFWILRKKLLKISQNLLIKMQICVILMVGKKIKISKGGINYDL